MTTLRACWRRRSARACRRLTASFAVACVVAACARRWLGTGGLAPAGARLTPEEPWGALVAGRFSLAPPSPSARPPRPPRHPYAPPDAAAFPNLTATLASTPGLAPVAAFLSDPLDGCGDWEALLEGFAAWHATARAALAAAAAARAAGAPAPAPAPRVIVWSCRESFDNTFYWVADDDCGGLADRLAGFANVLAFAIAHSWVVMQRNAVMAAVWHSPLLNVTFDTTLLPPPEEWLDGQFFNCPTSNTAEGGDGPPCPSALVPDNVDAAAGVRRWTRAAPVVLARVNRSPLRTSSLWLRAHLARTAAAAASAAQGAGGRAGPLPAAGGPAPRRAAAEPPPLPLPADFGALATLTPCLVRALWLPNAAVVHRLLPALAAALAPGAALVGVHWRAGDKAMAHRQHAVQSGDFDAEALWACVDAEEAARARAGDARPSRFVVVADVAAVRDAAAARYGRDRVVTSGVRSWHISKVQLYGDNVILFPEGVPNPELPPPGLPPPLERHITTAMDFFLLSRASAFVIPGLSGFSRYAWGYSLAPTAFVAGGAAGLVNGSCAQVTAAYAVRFGSGFRR